MDCWGYVIGKRIPRGAPPGQEIQVPPGLIYHRPPRPGHGAGDWDRRVRRRRPQLEGQQQGEHGRGHCGEEAIDRCVHPLSMRQGCIPGCITCHLCDTPPSSPPLPPTLSLPLLMTTGDIWVPYLSPSPVTRREEGRRPFPIVASSNLTTSLPSVGRGRHRRAFGTSATLNISRWQTFAAGRKVLV